MMRETRAEWSIIDNHKADITMRERTKRGAEIDFPPIIDSVFAGIDLFHFSLSVFPHNKNTRSKKSALNL